MGDQTQDQIQNPQEVQNSSSLGTKFLGRQMALDPVKMRRETLRHLRELSVNEAHVSRGSLSFKSNTNSGMIGN